MIIFIAFLMVYYLFIRLTRGITRSATCLMGKTAIVTGANSGVGYQTVLNLASRGCRIIMADIADMEESKRNVIKFTSNTNIVVKKINLTSFQSVRDFASDINKNEERLDILINNAGVFTSTDMKTIDGLNPVMQINFFSHFLLTHLLIDLLKKSAPSRIVFITSNAQYFHNLSFENLDWKTNYDTLPDGMDLYANSKLAVLIASDIFAKKLTGTGVTSNSVHPGIMKTTFFKEIFYVHRILILKLFFNYFYLPLYGKDSWEGSQCVVHVAVSNKLKEVTGKFFWDCVSFFKAPVAYNEKFCKEIWETSERCVKLKTSEKL